MYKDINVKLRLSEIWINKEDRHLYLITHEKYKFPKNTVIFLYMCHNPQMVPLPQVGPLPHVGPLLMHGIILQLFPVQE